MSDELAQEAKRIADGRTLNEFDQSAVEAVAGLTLRLEGARAAIGRDGMFVVDVKGDLVEHPAVMVEKRASAELRGWVKDRPDLFGQRSSSTVEKGAPSGRDKFGGFKLVN